jgi:hypothetical protein
MDCPNGCDNTRTVQRDDGTEWTGSDVIGVEVPGLYDGIAYWACPKCGCKWHRFTAPGRIRDHLARTNPEIVDRT